MSLYDSLASEANKLITEFGQSVTISRTTRTIDPVSGTSTSPTETGSFKAVNPPLSQSGIQSFDNGSIQEAQSIYQKIRILTIAALNAPFEPAKGDIVTLGVENYTIFGCTPVAPDGTKIVYRIGMGA